MSTSSSSSLSSTLPRRTPALPLAPLTWQRRALWVDVFFSGVAAVLMGAGHSALAARLGLPEELLIGAALVCAAWAVALGVLARAPHISRPWMWGVIAGNAAWAALSVALLVFEWVQPHAWGTGFVIAQAVAVAVFAELQWWALHRAR